MPENSNPDRTGQKRIVGYLILLVVFLLVWPLSQNGDSVDLYGVSVPVWLVALGFYGLGLAVAWAFQRPKRT